MEAETEEETFPYGKLREKLHQSITGWRWSPHKQEDQRQWCLRHSLPLFSTWKMDQGGLKRPELKDHVCENDNSQSTWDCAESAAPAGCLQIYRASWDSSRNPKRASWCHCKIKFLQKTENLMNHWSTGHFEKDTGLAGWPIWGGLDEKRECF